MTTSTISREELQTRVPSAFSEVPFGKMSDRYRHIPTIEAIDVLLERGFVITGARQTRSRSEDRLNHAKHIIKLRGQDYSSTDDVIPEVVLFNSSDGTSAYKFMLGIFNSICENGLINFSTNFGDVSVNHAGSKDLRAKVLAATAQVIENAPSATAKIVEWKNVDLSFERQLDYVDLAIEEIGIGHCMHENLLLARRAADDCRGGGHRSLWTTFNVVQENLMKGGVAGFTQTGRRTRTRSIKSVQRDIQVNKTLWKVTEDFANA